MWVTKISISTTTNTSLSHLNSQGKKRQMNWEMRKHRSKAAAEKDNLLTLANKSITTSGTSVQKFLKTISEFKIEFNIKKNKLFWQKKLYQNSHRWLRIWDQTDVQIYSAVLVPLMIIILASFLNLKR